MMSQYIFTITLALVASSLIAQEELPSYSLDASYQNGVILEHNPDIAHLIGGRTEAFLLKYNQHTNGKQTWHEQYNYPDWGFSFYYQNLGNEELGENYSLYGHYNFYFFKRHLNLSIGTGITYNTNPFDPINNPRNVAFGSSLMTTTYLGLSYKRKRIFKDWGLEAGVLLTHYSNGRLRTPNTSINTFSFSIGLNYSPKESESYITNTSLPKVSEPITWNFVLQGGANENNVVGLGRKAFIGFQTFVDKRVSYKSSFQLGTEVFISGALKDYIRYRSIAFPEQGIKGDEDTKRVGVFGGYELHISKIAIFIQLGYYIYHPVDFESRLYNRLGLKRYLSKNIYALATVKAHSAKAEALEFGIGYRL